MPKGFESTRAIRAFENELALKPAKMIALTGDASASAQQEAHASGLDLFLTKPIRFKDVARLLDSE